MAKKSKVSTKTSSRLSPATRALVAELRALVEQARDEAGRVLAEIRARTYWLMGEKIAAATKELGRRQLGDFLLQVGRQVGVERTVLWRALRFYLAFPEGMPATAGGAGAGLSWAACVELLPLRDPQARDFYLQQATRNRWSARRLRRAIKNRLFESSRPGAGARPEQLERPVSGLHTYAGEVERVIDGDTLLVRIDLGFDVWKSERIRLRGVDTPELGTPEGLRAREFVTGTLAGAGTVVVKTYKTDAYARYVADLFHHPALERKEDIFTRGHFLNQQLLDQGLAVKVVY